MLRFGDEPIFLAGNEEGGAGEAGGGGGGGGGRRGGPQPDELTFYMDIATPAALPAIEALPEPIIDFSEPVPDVPMPQLAVNEPTFSESALPGTPLDGVGEGPGQGTGAGPGSGSGTGGGSGSGVGTGTGAGEGPGSGRGGTIRPPEPIALLIPPMAPSNLRGREVRMRLQVSVTGRVTSVELLTSSGNARYDRELRRTAEGWQFRPARDPEGRAVAHFYEFSAGF